MHRTATCCCGKTSIEVEGEPKIHLVCHCNNCKKRTGSGFGLSAYFADSQIKGKQGETEIYEINNTETQQARYFCSNCGTTLYWKITRFPGLPGIAEMTGIASGCFVDAPLPAPSISAFNEHKCAWLELPGLRMIESPK